MIAVGRAGPEVNRLHSTRRRFTRVHDDVGYRARLAARFVKPSESYGRSIQSSRGDASRDAPVVYLPTLEMEPSARCTRVRLRITSPSDVASVRRLDEPLHAVNAV